MSEPAFVALVWGALALAALVFAYLVAALAGVGPWGGDWNGNKRGHGPETGGENR